MEAVATPRQSLKLTVVIVQRSAFPAHFHVPLPPKPWKPYSRAVTSFSVWNVIGMVEVVFPSPTCKRFYFLLAGVAAAGAGVGGVGPGAFPGGSGPDQLVQRHARRWKAGPDHGHRAGNRDRRGMYCCPGRDQRPGHRVLPVLKAVAVAVFFFFRIRPLAPTQRRVLLCLAASPGREREKKETRQSLADYLDVYTCRRPSSNLPFPLPS